jgi:hypothetical protein
VSPGWQPAAGLVATPI